MHSKKTSRPIDVSAKKIYSWWTKTYVFINKTQIKSWQAIFIIAFISGVASALIWSVSAGWHASSSAAGIIPLGECVAIPAGGEYSQVTSVQIKCGKNVKTAFFQWSNQAIQTIKTKTKDGLYANTEYKAKINQTLKVYGTSRSGNFSKEYIFKKGVIIPVNCGDGNIDSGEQCDNGGSNGADGVCMENCFYNINWTIPQERGLPGTYANWTFPIEAINKIEQKIIFNKIDHDKNVYYQIYESNMTNADENHYYFGLQTTDYQASDGLIFSRWFPAGVSAEDKLAHIKLPDGVSLSLDDFSITGNGEYQYISGDNKIGLGQIEGNTATIFYTNFNIEAGVEYSMILEKKNGWFEVSIKNNATGNVLVLGSIYFGENATIKSSGSSWVELFYQRSRLFKDLPSVDVTFKSMIANGSINPYVLETAYGGDIIANNIAYNSESKNVEIDLGPFVARNDKAQKYIMDEVPLYNIAKAYVQAISNGSQSKQVIYNNILLADYATCNPAEVWNDPCQRAVLGGKDGKTVFMELINENNFDSIFPPEDLARVYGSNSITDFSPTKTMLYYLAEPGNGWYSNLPAAKALLKSKIDNFKQ